MSEPQPEQPPALFDPWTGAPIPLDGRLERAQFPPWLTAVLVLFFALVLFQVVIAPIATFGLLLATGVSMDPDELIDVLASLATERTRLMLVANTIGQVFALAIPTMFIARLHSGHVASFLRVRLPDLKIVALAAVGLIGFFPVVQWLGELNASLPFPEFVRDFEKMMLEPIEKLLGEPGAFGFNILTIAVTPAICEEILFRGYVQRQAERSMGVVWGIAFTGLVFGMYHLQPTKVVPLAALGVFLGYITWRSGSLVPAILVHFLNNGIAVVIGTYAANKPDLSLEDLENLNIPWYIILLGAAIFCVTIYLMNAYARAGMQAVAADHAGKQEGLSHEG